MAYGICVFLLLSLLSIRTQAQVPNAVTIPNPVELPNLPRRRPVQLMDYAITSQPHSRYQQPHLSSQSDHSLKTGNAQSIPSPIANNRSMYGVAAMIKPSPRVRLGD
jgi:hypothetical protein